MCRMSWKSGSTKLLEPSGPHRACYGTALPLSLLYNYCTNIIKYNLFISFGHFYHLLAFRQTKTAKVTDNNHINWSSYCTRHHSYSTCHDTHYVQDGSKFKLFLFIYLRNLFSFEAMLVQFCRQISTFLLPWRKRHEFLRNSGTYISNWDVPERTTLYGHNNENLKFRCVIFGLLTNCLFRHQQSSSVVQDLPEQVLAI
jgi:hypothetical protein